MRIVLRPIDVWPGSLLSDSQRTPSPFEASWPQTKQLLEREVGMLQPKTVDIVVQYAVEPRDFRLDGEMRANARAPRHPGVIVSFESRKFGPMRYFTDQFTNRGYGGSRFLNGWQSNVRAVALGLEALRKVERYGIARRGEQYVGWSALPPAREMGAAPLTIDEAARLLCEATMETIGEDWHDIDRVRSVANSLWREAAKVHHPDAGGDPETFKRLTAARDLLLAAR